MRNPVAGPHIAVGYALFVNPCSMTKVLAVVAGVVPTAAAAAGGANFGPSLPAHDGAGGRMHGRGPGPTVLLIHGYAETSRMWKPLATRLRAAIHGGRRRSTARR